MKSNSSGASYDNILSLIDDEFLKFSSIVDPKFSDLLKEMKLVLEIISSEKAVLFSLLYTFVGLGAGSIVGVYYLLKSK